MSSPAGVGFKAIPALAELLTNRRQNQSRTDYSVQVQGQLAESITDFVGLLSQAQKFAHEALTDSDFSKSLTVAHSHGLTDQFVSEFIGRLHDVVHLSPLYPSDDPIRLVCRKYLVDSVLDSLGQSLSRSVKSIALEGRSVQSTHRRLKKAFGEIQGNIQELIKDRADVIQDPLSAPRLASLVASEMESKPFRFPYGVEVGHDEDGVRFDISVERIVDKASTTVFWTPGRARAAKAQINRLYHRKDLDTAIVSVANDLRWSSGFSSERISARPNPAP